ncbi:MAG: hypothetical protein B7Z73_07980 [Planctomycetia bacterium 21-64-5]|nr:MAG: hypothetical protein B7Z73_07980 [Planctomycetia bacterium 21-64-5]HQU44638.1 NAD(P)/FAD-dependent oxidoreductase [Pirellulales bacterium]
MSAAGDWNASLPAERYCDAVVIGAGPAGSMAARELARRGMRVLLVERKTLPRSKVCGACLNQRAVSWLELAGLSHVLPQLGAVPTKRFRACCGRRSVEIELPGGAAVSRESFDFALAQAAVDCGAQLLTGTTAMLRDVGSDAGGREIELRGPAGNTRTIQAGVVLAADGLGHPSLAQCREFACRVPRGAKLGVGTRTVDAPQSFQPGTIYMAIGRGGYAGLVRLEDGSLSLAAAVVPQAIKRAASPAAAVAAILAEAGMPECGLAEAGPWQGTLPLTQSTPRPVGHRVLVLGDAAGYVEPFTGEGIAWALSGGLAVAEFAERGLCEWNAHVEQGWLHAYRRLVRDRQLCCRGFAAVLRHPSIARMAVQLASAWPAVCRPIVRTLNRPVRPLELCQS